MAAVGLDNMLSTLGLSRAFAEQLGRSLQVRTNAKSGAEALLYAQYSALNMQQLPSSNGSMVPQGWVPGPGDYIRANAGGMAPTGNGFGGINMGGAFGNDPVMNSLQAALAQNPQFRAQIEALLKGQVVGADGGSLTVWQPPAQANRIGQTTRGLLAKAPPQGSIQYSLGNMNVQLTPGALGGPQGGILRGLQQLEANIASFASNMGTGGMDPTVQKYAQQAGINTQNPRFEELVFLNMMSYTSRKEGEIQGKVQALSQDGTANTQNAGFFGGLTDTVGGATARAFGLDIPAAAGYPALAGGQGIQAQTAPGAAVGGGPAMDAQGNVINPNALSETAKQQMLQKMMGDLQKLYEMLSNMIKSMHDMQMGAIRNIRS